MRMTAIITAAGIALAIPRGSDAQDPRKFNPEDVVAGVDMVKVEAAIKRGVEYLKGKNRDHFNVSHSHKSKKTNVELVLLTYAHSGYVNESDPAFRDLFNDMMKRPLEATYCVVLQAMVLDEVDRIKYQPRIWQCAQFLVDNQCRNGQWSYGEQTRAIQGVPTGAPSSVSTGPKGGVRIYDVAPAGGREKPKPVRTLPVRRTREGPSSGDNSNSQYAALGLRACHDAGIAIPRDVVGLAMKWWKENQKGRSEKGREAVSTGAIDLGPPRGWCYNDHNHGAFGSMTAGAVGALVIYNYMLDGDWSRDSSVRSGLSWMMHNYSVTQNPGDPCTFGKNNKVHYHYYMYALERVGMLYGTAKIGNHSWYAEGAEHLLKTQQGDGSWKGSDGSKDTWDTCFAILFLKRATRPLVASEDASRK